MRRSRLSSALRYGEHTPGRRSSGPRRRGGMRPRQISVMDVAGEHPDGGRRSPCSPEATSRMSSASRWNDAWKAPQWSKSSAWRMRSARRRPASPRSPAHPLVPGLQVLEAGTSRPGVRAPRGDGRSRPLVERSDPLPFLVVDDRAPALLEQCARCESRARSAASCRGRGNSSSVFPRDPVVRPWSAHHLGDASSASLTASTSGRSGELSRREVAEELIKPVGHHPPITRSCHQAGAPCPRHQAREMFQSSRMSWSSITIELETVENSQRTRVAPRLPVEARVLLEVGDLLGGAPGGRRRSWMNSRRLAARPGRRRPDRREEEQVGPAARPRSSRELLGEGVQGVEPASVLLVVSLRQGVGRLVGQRHAAGAEHELEPAPALERPDDARRELESGGGQAPRRPALTSYSSLEPGSRPIDADQRVLVSLDRERPAPRRRGPRPRTARRSPPRWWPRCCPTSRSSGPSTRPAIAGMLSEQLGAPRRPPNAALGARPTPRVARVAGANVVIAPPGSQELGNHLQRVRGSARRAVGILALPVRQVLQGGGGRRSSAPGLPGLAGSGPCPSSRSPSRCTGSGGSTARPRARRCPASGPGRGSAGGRGADRPRLDVGLVVGHLVVAEGDVQQHLVRRRVRQRVVGHPVRVAVGLAPVPEHLHQVERISGRDDLVRVAG